MKRSCIPALVLLVAGGFTCAAIFAQAPAADQKPEIPAIVETLPNQAQGVIGYGGNHSLLWGQTGSRNKTHELAKQYVSTEKEDEKKKIRKDLADVLAQQFEAHAKHQEKELADLENQIAKLRATLKKRQENKMAIIDHRVDQLIRDAEGLGWTAPGAPESALNLVPLQRFQRQ
jgi:flagellar motility protein MotE (MotC chaperone)